MMRDEAKAILLLYRPDASDGADPEMAEALALAGQDSELKRWLADHCAAQAALAERFRAIKPPEGLKEQIISEYAAQLKSARWKRATALAAAAAALVCLLVISLSQPSSSNDDNYAHYRSRMVSAALRGYAMDFDSNDSAAIQMFLARREAPASYRLPAGLRAAEMTGCAVQRWQRGKVSMLCFRTGRPLKPGEKSDLWLFVIDRALLKDAPRLEMPEFAQVSRLHTVAWLDGDKVYLMGVEGDDAVLRRYL